MIMRLRQNAEQRLKEGTAPATRGLPAGAEALALLHGLASAPGTASDALKLLHELQVHQVELDLLHEQAENEEHRLTEELSDYTAAFNLAPFAYVTLEPEGMVIAMNRIAVEWFAPGTGAGDEWAGRHIEELLAPECRAAIRNMLGALRRGEGRQTCVVQSKTGGASACAVATATSGGGRILMAFVSTAPAPGH